MTMFPELFGELMKSVYSTAMSALLNKETLALQQLSSRMLQEYGFSSNLESY